MARHSIIEKIDREIRRSPMNEPLAVYLLVEIRKLAEHDRSLRTRYRTLMLCCDWAAHTRLDRERAQEKVTLANAIVEKIRNRSITSDEIEEFHRFFSFEDMRRDLDSFCGDHALQSLDQPGWEQFLQCFLNVITDCTLACKANQDHLLHVDTVNVVALKGQLQKPDCDSPPMLIQLLKDGAVEMSMVANCDLPLPEIISMMKRRAGK